MRNLHKTDSADGYGMFFPSSMTNDRWKKLPTHHPIRPKACGHTVHPTLDCLLVIFGGRATAHVRDEEEIEWHVGSWFPLKLIIVHCSIQSCICFCHQYSAKTRRYSDQIHFIWRNIFLEFLLYLQNSKKSTYGQPDLHFFIKKHFPSNFFSNHLVIDKSRENSSPNVRLMKMLTVNQHLLLKKI